MIKETLIELLGDNINSTYAILLDSIEYDYNLLKDMQSEIAKRGSTIVQIDTRFGTERIMKHPVLSDMIKLSSKIVKEITDILKICDITIEKKDEFLKELDL